MPLRLAKLHVLSRLLLALCLLAACLMVGACGPRPDNSQLKLPEPIESTTIGPGDVFSMQIVGEKELPTEYQVASDGTVDLPYLQAVKVAGLEPQQIARLVREKLIEKQILTDPSVIVSIKEYNSKRVTVNGHVSKPGTFPLTPGLTLIQLISLAGGLTPIGNADRVNLTRKTKEGSKTVTVSVRAINDGRSPDIPLQAGDAIYVYERLF